MNCTISNKRQAGEVEKPLPLLSTILHLMMMITAMVMIIVMNIVMIIVMNNSIISLDFGDFNLVWPSKCYGEHVNSAWAVVLNLTKRSLSQLKEEVILNNLVSLDIDD